MGRTSAIRRRTIPGRAPRAVPVSWWNREPDPPPEWPRTAARWLAARLGPRLLQISGPLADSVRGPDGPLTRADFVERLRTWGLLGRTFREAEGVAAVARSLPHPVQVLDYPDVSEPDVEGAHARAEGYPQGLLDGCLAEVAYHEGRGEALILVRESLRYRPWPLRELCVYEELAHLVLGHPARLIRAATPRPPGPARIRGLSVSDARKKLLRPGRPTEPAPDAVPEAVPDAVPDAVAVGTVEPDVVWRSEVAEPEARQMARWLVVASVEPGVFAPPPSRRYT